MIASSEVRLSSTRLPTPQNKSTVHHNQRPPTPGREPWGGWALTNEALALSRPWRPDRTLSWLSQQCSGPLPITPHWGPTLLARCWARPPWPSTTRGRQGADFRAPAEDASFTGGWCLHRRALRSAASCFGHIARRRLRPQARGSRHHHRRRHLLARHHRSITPSSPRSDRLRI